MANIWPITNHVAVAPTIQINDPSLNRVWRVSSIAVLCFLPFFLYAVSCPTKQVPTGLNIHDIQFVSHNPIDPSKPLREARYCQEPDLYRCDWSHHEVHAAGCTSSIGLPELVYNYGNNIGEAMFFLPTMLHWSNYDTHPAPQHRVNLQHNDNFTSELQAKWDLGRCGEPHVTCKAFATDLENNSYLLALSDGRPSIVNERCSLDTGCKNGCDWTDTYFCPWHPNVTDNPANKDGTDNYLCCCEFRRNASQPCGYSSKPSPRESLRNVDIYSTADCFTPQGDDRYISCVWVESDGRPKFCKCELAQASNGQWFVPGATEHGALYFKVKPSVPYMHLGKGVNPPICRINGRPPPSWAKNQELGTMDCKASLEVDGKPIRELNDDQIFHKDQYGALAIDINKLFQELYKIGRPDNYDLATDVEQETLGEVKRNRHHVDTMIRVKGIGEMHMDWGSLDWKSTDGFQDPELCSPRARGGMFEIRVSTIGNDEHWLPDVRSLICWSGLRFLEVWWHARYGHWACVRVQFNIRYKRLGFLDRKESLRMINASAGQLRTEQIKHAGFFYQFREEGDFISSFDVNAAILAIVSSVTTILVLPRLLVTRLARCRKVMGAKSTIYERACTRVFDLRSEALSWVCRTLNAVDTFRNLDGQCGKKDDLTSAFKRRLQEVLADADDKEASDGIFDVLCDAYGDEDMGASMDIAKWVDAAHSGQILTTGMILDFFQDPGQSAEDCVEALRATTEVEVANSGGARCPLNSASDSEMSTPRM